MSTKSIFTLMLLTVVLSARAQTITYADTITIPVLTKVDTSLSHGFHDVVVVYQDNFYIIDYYCYRDSKITPYRIKIQGGPLYDKVNYTWQTDRQALIQLIDSESDFTMRFKIWGEGNETGMEMLPD